MTNRRQILKRIGAAGGIATTGLLAGCSGAGDDGGNDNGNGGNGNGGATGTASSTVSLKLGGLLPLTGAYSKAGVSQRIGMKVGRDHVKEEYGDDVEIELVYSDTELSPDVALQRARELIQNENVDALVGPTSSAASRAILPLVEQEQTPVLNSGSAAMDLTGEGCNPYYFRYSVQAQQMSKTHLQFASQELGKKYAFIGADYAWPQSAHQALNSFEDQYDSTESIALWPSLGASDYSTEIQKIANSDADYIMGRLSGTDASNFIRQADSFGLFDDKPLMGVSAWGPISSTGAAAIGSYSAMPYIWEIDSEANNDYISKFQDNAEEGFQFPEVRTVAASLGVIGAAQAAVEAGSNNPDKMAAQLEGQEGSYPVSYHLRACDHQASYEQLAYEVVESDEYDHPVREIQGRVSMGDDLPPCSESACDGPFY